MLRSSLAVVAVALVVVHAQYPYQQQQNHQQSGGYSPFNQQPQQYGSSSAAPSTPAPTGSYNPAPVHYVNIGAQLQGDYKFGYDAGNGAFREETRGADGSVTGQYGYVDANGMKRTVRYRAGKEGFMAEGDGIEKPAPAAAPQAPQQQYNPPAQQYNPPQQQYNPPQQQYNPPPQQNYNQYQPQQQTSAPVSFDPQLLSYNIGTARRS